MFAQESVMDIQKEKIAHEKHLLSQGVDFKYLPNIQYSELENVYELIEWDEEYSEALNEINSSWCTWQAAKAQAVPEGYVLVPREMQWHKADDLACLEWGRHVGLFCSENRDMSALQVEEFRLRWCKNKANKIMSDYKAMIEAQEPTND